MQPGGQGLGSAPDRALPLYQRKSAVWGGAQPKSNFVHFNTQNLTSSGNDSSDFTDKSTGQIYDSLNNKGIS